jgi:hypothetical protein
MTPPCNKVHQDHVRRAIDGGMQSPSTTDMETFADIQTFEDITMKGKSIYTRAILEQAAQHFDKSISLVQ